MHHAWGSRHQIGRLRVSIATHPIGDTPADIAAIVAKDSALRSPDEQTQLTEYVAGRFGSAQLRNAVRRLKQLRGQLAELQQIPPTMVMAEMEQPRNSRVLYRGEYDKPREEVQPGTPEALPPNCQSIFREIALGWLARLVMPDLR